MNDKQQELLTDTPWEEDDEQNKANKLAERHRSGGQLADLRAAAMGMSPQQIDEAFNEYEARRAKFRERLLKQLVEGVHFGFPPGTEPKYNDNGEPLMWVKGRGDEKGYWKVISDKQWQPKPCLYKAGADFVCDLLGVRDEYKADNDAWSQLGSKPGTFVFACYLYSKATGDLLGEGRGVRKVGQKGGDENNAIKMAKKCAKVDAVLNAYGLADLFTQDLDDRRKPNENPTADDTKPKVQPRTDRVSAEALAELVEQWKAKIQGLPDDSERVRDRFNRWVGKNLNREIAASGSLRPSSPSWWSRSDFNTAKQIVREL